MPLWDDRWGRVPYMLDAATELARQIKSQQGKPSRAEELEVIRATGTVAAALADLQVILGKQYAQGLDKPTADMWRAAVEHLRAASEGLPVVFEQLNRPDAG